jgi:acetoin utilization protein AcuC
MSEPTCSARLVYRPEYEAYDFGPEHPLQPARIRTALDLIRSSGLGPAPEQRLAPPPASLEDLQLVHSRRYVEAVQSLDAFADDPLMAIEAARWGLGPGDSPAFVGMQSA